MHTPNHQPTHIHTSKTINTQTLPHVHPSGNNNEGRMRETNIWFVTFETLMFKPKGRAHSNVFIHLHKHHLSRHRQLLKHRKFSGSLHTSQSTPAQLWYHHPDRFQVSESAQSRAVGAGERMLLFHVIRQWQKGDTQKNRARNHNWHPVVIYAAPLFILPTNLFHLKDCKRDHLADIWCFAAMRLPKALLANYCRKFCHTCIV